MIHTRLALVGVLLLTAQQVNACAVINEQAAEASALDEIVCSGGLLPGGEEH